MLNNITREETRVLLQKMIGEIMNIPGISEWDMNFLSNIRHRLVSRDLTEKQANILNKIKRKYIG